MTVPVVATICPHCGTYLWPRPMELGDFLPRHIWGKDRFCRPMVEWFMEPWVGGWYE